MPARRNIRRRRKHDNSSGIEQRRFGNRIGQNCCGGQNRSAQDAMKFAGCGRGCIRIGGVRRTGVTAAETENVPSGDIRGLRIGRQRLEGREQGLQRNGVGRDQTDRCPKPHALDETRHSNPTRRYPYQR